MLDYLKEAFKQFTNHVTSLGDDEITNHYSKLQSQADRGLLDEQLLKITSTELVNSFKAMIKIKPQVLFYGESSIKELRAVLSNSFVDKANSENKLEIEYERKNMDGHKSLALRMLATP